MVRGLDATTKSSQNVRAIMNSVKLLLTVCFYVLVFETDALKRFHRKPYNWYNAIDELSDAIRIHHRNKAFIFSISGPRNRHFKRKLTGFANKAHVAPGPSRFSKRCFPGGYGFPPVMSPPWWPPPFDPQWPEYNLEMGGYGYPFPGPYGWNGCETCSQSFPCFPIPWGMCCSCGESGAPGPEPCEGSQKPTEAPTTQTTKGITQAPTSSAATSQAPTTSKATSPTAKTTGGTAQASKTQPTSPAGPTSPTTASGSQSTDDDAHKPTSRYNDIRKYKIRLLKQRLRRKGNKNGVVIVM